MNQHSHLTKNKAQITKMKYKDKNHITKKQRDEPRNKEWGATLFCFARSAWE